jgi:hypothetical protein
MNIQEESVNQEKSGNENSPRIKEVRAKRISDRIIKELEEMCKKELENKENEKFEIIKPINANEDLIYCMYKEVEPEEVFLEVASKRSLVKELESLRRFIIALFAEKSSNEFYSTEENEIFEGEKYNLSKSLVSILFTDQSSITGACSIVSSKSVTNALEEFGYLSAKFQHENNKTPLLMVYSSQVLIDELEFISTTLSGNNMDSLIINIPVFRSPCGVGVLVYEMAQKIMSRKNIECFESVKIGVQKYFQEIQ